MRFRDRAPLSGRARLSRCGALAIAIVVACCPVARAADAADPPAPDTERPNIILLIGDDHGFSDFGLTGSELVKTPNLDDLATGGTVFLRTYSTSNVCAPALGTLLTGLYPAQWDHRLRWLRGVSGGQIRRANAIESFATLPRLLGTQGYVSFQAGKFWESSAKAAGFTAGTVNDPKRKPLAGDGRFGRDSIAPALDFIDANAARPFFLWFAPMLPHIPHDPPERLLREYDGKGLSPKARAYYANCTRFDELVGRLVSHLKKRGIRERTLLVYLSDNGYEQKPKAKRVGTHGKETMHEPAFRTPLVFNWPGHLPAGRVDDRLVSFVDLFPTLLDYGGVSGVPAGRLGIDLRPLLEGGDAPPRSVVIGEVYRPEKRGGPKKRSSYLRSDRWHYIWFETDRREELYDKNADPEESKNVVADHPDVAADFRRQVTEWKTEVTQAVAGIGRKPAAPPS